jgi:hypothetical protein
VFGCAGMKIERGVKKNIFYSSRFPKIDININPEFIYFGKTGKRIYRKYKTSPGGSFRDDESYIWGKLTKVNALEAIFIIRFERMNRGYFLENQFSDVKDKLDSGTIDINGKIYQFLIKASASQLSNYQELYLYDKGYQIPTCFLAKVLVRRYTHLNENDSLIKILYLEDINYNRNSKDTCRNWKDKNKLSEDRRNHFKEFISRNNEYVQIVNDK